MVNGFDFMQNLTTVFALDNNFEFFYFVENA